MTPEISELKIDEVASYADLIREVYGEFVAGDYSDAGNRTFYNFISHDSILQRMKKGNLMLCAKIGRKIAGAHEIRDRNHVSLFFVKAQYHHKGIGKALFGHSLDRIVSNFPEIEIITVHSSPYALNIYKRLGFVETSGIQEKDGSRYYPMEYRIV